MMRLRLGALSTAAHIFCDSADVFFFSTFFFRAVPLDEKQTKKIENSSQYYVYAKSGNRAVAVMPSRTYY